jgi:hypothetical protein
LQVHVGNIVDLAWTPDGYTLIACSNDDTISVIRCVAVSGVQGAAAGSCVAHTWLQQLEQKLMIAHCLRL